jgi:hypothetical protein
VIVLFYVYPLKYLTKAILIPISTMFNQELLKADLRAMYGGANMSDLMIIYGLGAMAVFFTLTLMYRYALKKAADLQLNEIETFDTKISMRSNFVMGIIPLLSVLVAILTYNNKWSGLFSGITYFLYPIAMRIFWGIHGRKRDQILEASEPADSLQYPAKEDL